MHNARVLLVIDLIGVFVFGLAGATAAVRQRLDLFGVLVLSFATASAAGRPHTSARLSPDTQKPVAKFS